MWYLNEILSRCQAAYDLTWDSPHEIIQRGNAQALFARNKNLVHIFIAGTNDVRDVIQAAKTCGRRNRHLGFYTHSLRLKKAIEKRIGKRDTVSITGHSLGGVTAQFLSLDLAGYCHNILVHSVAAPKGFRTPFHLPPSVRWNIYTNDLDMIPDYPLTKSFDWRSMQSQNAATLSIIQLTNNKLGKPYSFLQRMMKVLGPSWLHGKPFTEGYERVAKYHSLKHYMRLCNAKEEREESL